ncbi:Imm1 family immunity protein [Saccharothrix xinjiangensis]|uniref:Imm1 family immunity protein n=1 Tax=Saccharothrix xinjiangensis TaxID=204798 RepID=A0ABV9YGU0_9PSEU
MATLNAIHDTGPDIEPVLIHTQDELTGFVDRVRADSAEHDHPPVVEFTLAQDPWGSPVLYAGIGRDRGFVQYLPPGGTARATQGDPQATGMAVYDLQGQEHLVPAAQQVPLATVQALLAAYLAGHGVLPADQPELHPLDPS